MIVAGAGSYLAVRGKLSQTDERRAYWANFRKTQPVLANCGPPLLLVLGIFRLGYALLG
jgi:hypothetical protein